MCTINKSAHTKKSGNLFDDPHAFDCMTVFDLLWKIWRIKIQNNFKKLFLIKNVKNSIS